ncbi:MFS transporter [Bacillus sp. FJAT-49732]|uniref:MFS transporter n=1 Tax=Lederbergia citrisecunda TaxID=2833583 RepID=A0A942TJJ4_9BACI|nr:MFS transporter [Lederbergia citrisecunda]MBS4198790.1 MFS transporter [Lederbergia citrisecunda]
MLQLSMFNFFFYWAMSIINAFFPLLFRYKGLSPGQIGIVLAVGPVVAIFSQPLWGIISDKKQTVKKIIILLLVATLIIGLAIFFSPTMLLLIICMLVFHFFMSPIQPLLDSLSTTFAKENGISYGSIRVWGSIGFATASFIIGFIIGKIGIQYLWIIYTIIIVGVFFIALKLSDSKAVRKPVTKEGFKKAFRNPSFFIFLIAVLFIAIPHRMNDGMLALYLKSLGAPEGLIGLAWTFSALSEAPVVGIMYILMRRIPLLVLVSIAGCFYTLRWFLYSLLSEPILIVSSQAMHSVTFAIFMVASLQYIASVIPREMIATGQTAYFATFNGLAPIIGSSAGGYLMEHFGGGFIYRMGSFSALIGTFIVVFLFLKERKVQNEKQYA